MDFNVRREMATAKSPELFQLFEEDRRQGKFWFRLYVNDCGNVDDLFLFLLKSGLMDFQARQVCIDFGERENSRGETIADICGLKEGDIMSFAVSASTEDELEEKVNFFVEGLKKMKEAVNTYLLHQVPEWVKEKKRDHV